MPSRKSMLAAWRVLLRKEWRELLASRAYWVLLALSGPLVGLSFGNGVRSYSEVSAGAGNACGIVCAPLIGIWSPTFSAYEIAAIFLLPPGSGMSARTSVCPPITASLPPPGP